MLKAAQTKPPRPIAEFILATAVVFVPFQQALTVDVSFPLKITEILAMAAIALFLIERRKATFPARNGRTLLVLGLIVFLSTIWNILRELPWDSSPGYNYGFTFDIVQYAGYGFLVLVVAWVMATRLGHEGIGKAISWAIRLAFVYCIVQFAFWSAGSRDALEAINGTTQIGRSYGIPLPRNGPFLEGNYLGFFAGAALLIAGKRKDWLGVVLGAACLLYSQSTVGIVAVAIALLAMVAFRPTAKALSGSLAVAAAALGGAMFIPQAKDFVEVQLGKLGLGTSSSELEALGYSLRSRTLNSEAGFTMGADNWPLGVGPGRFGVWYDVYVNRANVPISLFSDTKRAIANNAYAQIYSELGIFALGALVFLLLALFVILRKKRPGDIPVLVFVAVGLNATPAWTILPTWIILAYLMAAAAAPKEEPAPKKARKVKPQLSSAYRKFTPERVT